MIGHSDLHMHAAHKHFLDNPLSKMLKRADDL